MQALPMVERVYPGHWVFEEHPLFNDETGVFDVEGRWDSWSRLAAMTYDAAEEHQRVSALVYGATACAPFKPSHELARLAMQLGATWAADRLSAVEAADPVKAVSRRLRAVRHRSAQTDSCGALATHL